MGTCMVYGYSYNLALELDFLGHIIRLVYSRVIMYYCMYLFLLGMMQIVNTSDSNDVLGRHFHGNSFDSRLLCNEAAGGSLPCW
jgi:hypothetical protein